MTALRETRSTCPYCGVGCGVVIESKGEQITGVRGDPDHPANFGRLCSKGSTLHLTASAPITQHARLLFPMRRAHRDAAPQPLSWNEAMTLATDRFEQAIRTHGPDTVGFYLSGQLLTEDYYVFNKLAKALIGTNNVDTNSRLCMSSAVAGYKATLGADAPPACYDDLAHARTLFITGANTAWAHPILFRRIEDAKRADPRLRIIVADPRRTDTAAAADLHLPLLPGSDVALYHGLLHLMLAEGWLDRDYIEAHTQGFEALRVRVAEFTPRETSRLTGLTEPALLQAAAWFAGLDVPGEGRSPTLSLYCQGLNQSASGTAKNAALINLHLATGQIGRAGAGPFSLTGQPNAMGGREVGGLSNLLPAHRDLANPAHRAEMAAFWGVPRIPEQPGKSAVEMFKAAAEGQIKALWIACTNPAQSMPDQALVREALRRCDFVVVQEAFSTTATAAFADLLLPATTWGEKEGTVTNSERRISRVRRAVAAPGQARHDWHIATELAQRLEGRLRPGEMPLFDYSTPEQVWNEHRETTRGRDLDITGLSYALLDSAGPQQWPLPAGQTSGRARLYEDGVFPTEDGRARFFDTPFEPVAEPRDVRHPFSLNTGRLRDQWHGMSRTGNLGRLFGQAPEPTVDLHPHELQRLGLQPGDLVHVTSRRGSIVLPAAADEGLGPMQAYIAMHWGEEFVSGRSARGEPLAGVNALTTPRYCPRSKQPELKHCAVKLLKAELPWRLTALAWLPDEELLPARRALQALMHEFSHALCVPFGHQRSGLMFKAAHEGPPPMSLVRRIETLMGLAYGSHDAPVLHYEDARRGQRRAVRLRHVQEDRRLEAFLLAGDARAESWLKPLLQDELPTQAYGRQLLQGGPQPPVPTPVRGRQVCTCFNVSTTDIEAVLPRCSGDAAERLQQLQAALKCGTNCGSCIPELKRLVAAPVTA